MLNKSKFKINEIVEVQPQALKEQCLKAIKQGHLHHMSLEYLLEYPIGVVQNKKQDENNQWNYLLDFLDCEATMFFKEQELDPTGKFISPNKFNYCEIVKIVTPLEENKKFIYFTGTVSGYSTDRDGKWWYAVSMYDCVRSFSESELESTGKYAKKEDFLTNEHVKVVVYPDGRGELKKAK